MRPEIAKTSDWKWTWFDIDSICPLTFYDKESNQQQSKGTSYNAILET